MTALAPTLESFFTQRLIGQRRVSPNTVAAYRDAWRLLLGYASDRIGKQPSQLDMADLDAPFLAGFLDHLEAKRGNSVRTRNARLAAVRSFFRYAALCHPEHAGLIARVLAIPTKRAERNELSYLDQPEVDALLASPDRETWTGRRDHALIDVAVDTGLRVSELTGLKNSDIELGAGAHLRCMGKGRKYRATPLRKETAAVLAVWMRERGVDPTTHSFPHGGEVGSDEERLSGGWPSMRPRRLAAARHSTPNASHPTSSATAVPCPSSLKELTRQSSLSGSGTNASRPPRSTCMPTCRSRSGRWLERRHRTPSRGDTEQLTRCSRS